MLKNLHYARKLLVEFRTKCKKNTRHALRVLVPSSRNALFLLKDGACEGCDDDCQHKLRNRRGFLLLVTSPTFSHFNAPFLFCTDIILSLNSDFMQELKKTLRGTLNVYDLCLYPEKACLCPWPLQHSIQDLSGALRGCSFY